MDLNYHNTLCKCLKKNHSVFFSCPTFSVILSCEEPGISGDKTSYQAMWKGLFKWQPTVVQKSSLHSFFFFFLLHLCGCCLGSWASSNRARKTKLIGEWKLKLRKWIKCQKLLVPDGQQSSISWLIFMGIIPLSQLWPCDTDFSPSSYGHD